MPDMVHRPISSPLLRTPPGPWSNAIEVLPGARYLYTCGLVGVRQDGTMEEGIAAQAVRIFENIHILLREANMDMSHVVKIISYLVDVADQPAYAKARAPYPRHGAAGNDHARHLATRASDACASKSR